MDRVFLSYSSTDRGFVEQLVRDLRANGVEPWYDQWEMLPGDSLIQKIGGAILDNQYFLVVLSPNSVDCEWVQRELGVALNHEFQEREVRVIPVLYQDCKMPPFLGDKVYADFRQNYRQGLSRLLGAINRRVTSTTLETSVPTKPPNYLVWNNVVGDSLRDENIVGTNLVD